eukprot:UN01304
MIFSSPSTLYTEQFADQGNVKLIAYNDGNWEAEAGIPRTRVDDDPGVVVVDHDGEVTFWSDIIFLRRSFVVVQKT